MACRIDFEARLPGSCNPVTPAYTTGDFLIRRKQNRTAIQIRGVMDLATGIQFGILICMLVGIPGILYGIYSQRRTGKHELTQEQTDLIAQLTEKVDKLEASEKECQAERKKQSEVEERLRRELIDKEKISYALISENYQLLKQLSEYEKTKRA
jgi:hypothetical protein